MCMVVGVGVGVGVGGGSSCYFINAYCERYEIPIYQHLPRCTSRFQEVISYPSV